MVSARCEEPYLLHSLVQLGCMRLKTLSAWVINKVLGSHAMGKSFILTVSQSVKLVERRYFLQTTSHGCHAIKRICRCLYGLNDWCFCY